MPVHLLPTFDPLSPALSFLFISFLALNAGVLAKGYFVLFHFCPKSLSSNRNSSLAPDFINYTSDQNTSSFALTSSHRLLRHCLSLSLSVCLSLSPHTHTHTYRYIYVCMYIFLTLSLALSFYHATHILHPSIQSSWFQFSLVISSTRLANR